MTEPPRSVSPRASTTWRLIDEVGTARDPIEHMDADVQLLDEVANGATPALRLYTWAQPMLSIGRFQDVTDVDSTACDRLGVRVVRRPTGGAALLHGADLTYSVVMPLPAGRDGAVHQMYELIAHALIAGLELMGVHAAIARNDGPPGPVCFAGQQGADLRVANQKVCGSAQARQRGAVLQHGSILMRRLAIDESDVTSGPCDRAALRNATVTLEELGAPCDPRRVAGAIVTGFAQSMCLAFAPPTLTAQGAGSIADAPSSASVPL